MQKQHTERIQLFQTSSTYISRVGLMLDMQSRFIGKLDKAGEGTFISTNRNEKHVFKKTNALGLNLELLQRFDFRWVMVPYCGRQLWTSKLYLLHHGKVFTFPGFESQIFLPLDEWGIEKARLFEAQLVVQGNLFEEVA